MSNGELQELLDFAVAVAREAGEITLRYFRREFETRLKGKDNFVTQADWEAEEYLRRRVGEEFPADAIIGEEGGESAGSTDRRWIIDPIDGTYSFVHGVPFYGVLLGVEVGGEPSVGVINIPALGEIVYAARGLGCFWNGGRARVSQTAALEDALLLSTDFGTCSAYGFGPAADELERRAAMRRTWGDCYGYVLVATGRAGRRRGRRHVHGLERASFDSFRKRRRHERHSVRRGHASHRGELTNSPGIHGPVSQEFRPGAVEE